MQNSQKSVFFSFLCMWAEKVQLNDPRLEKCSFPPWFLCVVGDDKPKI